MGNKIYLVDTFAEKPFTGNPACVCILSEKVSDEWMQNVAFEMQFSVTAFLLQKESRFNLRWFTTKQELKLCGYATMATAHILWENNIVPLKEPIEFDTLNGIIPVRKSGTLIEMVLESQLPKLVDFSPSLISVFDVIPRYVGAFSNGLLIEVENEKMVTSVEPDIKKLKTFDLKGVVITSRARSKDIDFVSRYFSPWEGVDEDPVTGSTHSCLAPYWSMKMGKKELKAYQASKRGGYLNLRVEENQVFVAGNAITVHRGELLV